MLRIASPTQDKIFPISLFFIFQCLFNVTFYFQIFIYLFLNTYLPFCYLFGCTGSQLHIGSSVVACELFVMACGIQFPQQGLNLGPLHWECVVLATIEVPDIIFYIQHLQIILMLERKQGLLTLFDPEVHDRSLFVCLSSLRCLFMLYQIATHPNLFILSTASY